VDYAHGANAEQPNKGRAKQLGHEKLLSWKVEMFCIPVQLPEHKMLWPMRQLASRARRTARFS
jgi:hypothetical protein